MTMKVLGSLDKIIILYNDQRSVSDMSAYHSKNS